jgi:hypothetical protein
MSKIKGITDYSKYFDTAKKALKKKKKSTDHRGLNTKHNYSSFWMDDEWDSQSKFSGMGSSSGYNSTDIVKLVKLSNYRRAITNFVKIVTKQDLPVSWAGDTSYTDGKSITLTTDIKDTNFDVTVGLALHEAAHCVLTDFSVLSPLLDGTCKKYHDFLDSLSDDVKRSVSPGQRKDLVRNLLNWIEDRRIDNYIFTTSPGYKAYYHKMYDHYWNGKDITKGFIASKFRNASDMESYMFHIINMLNPSFNPKALPGLEEITKLIDVNNIARLQNTHEAYDIALAVAKIVMENMVMDENKQFLQPPTPNNSNDDKDNNDNNDLSGSGDSGSSTNNGDGEGNGGDGDEEGDDTIELSSKELSDLKKILQEQKDFINGDTKKKSTTKNLQRQLNKIAEQSIDLQVIGDGLPQKRTSLIYDYTKNNTLQRVHALYLLRASDEYSELSYRDPKRVALDEELDSLAVYQDFKYLHADNIKSINAGMEMGALLGKKLQLHNESRERVDNRLRSGKIDNKRLAHAGYGIEGIFKQIQIDRYKKANLHISLDGSGSMSGEKWKSTIRMTMAIAKAATYTQNINIQVSIRVTHNAAGKGDVPTILYVYDSRKNKINQLVSALTMFRPSSMTPEGLCFEAMLKRNMFVSSDNDMDSYFLNISDGEPSCTNYAGHLAVNHTKAQINKMKNELNMSVISFFLGSGTYEQLVTIFNGYGSGHNFRTMYGKDAAVVNPENTLMIAKELNKKFLTKANA